jgi:beta-galactosidase
MNKTARFFVWSALAAGCAAASGKPAADAQPCRERLSMDSGWRFAFGRASDPRKDFNHATGYFSYFAKAGYGDGPAAKNFDDRAWRKLDLPHDWAVELPFDPKAGYSHGFKTVGMNFPETSVGWYRRTFFIPASDLGRRITVEFDGAHRNSTVWMNGFYLGRENSGTVGFRYDLTDYLRYGGENVLSVRVDAAMEEGWYYEGAGIYRHVRLVKTAPLHVAPHGTFVAAEVGERAAKLSFLTEVANEGTGAAGFDIVQTVIDAERRKAGAVESRRYLVPPGGVQEVRDDILMDDPALWSPESPVLYTLVTEVRVGGGIIDRVETPFGIRSVRFDAEKGFFLNGKSVRLRGTNLHQDHAGVGTALPDALWEFRIRRMKEMGSNAVRCSHQPPAPEFLDACDRLGMLVIDENRLMGSNDEHLDLLGRMIRRDRNHPCVVVWSIGNEEWAIEGNETGARIGRTMQDFTMRLDPTRRVTYANSGWGRGISEISDVMGFNYIFNGDIDRQHAAFPGQPGMGTEETTSRGTRGVYEDDAPNGRMEATDRKPEGRSIEQGFQFYAARPFLAGLFFWTGFDYRGEPQPFGWPQVVSQCGIVDLCGFPKDMFHYLRSWWTDTPVLHLLPHWNWRGREGQPIRVWAYSNCAEVELFLNRKSFGRQAMPPNGHLEWSVPFRPGILSAKGYTGGRETAFDRVETSGEPAAVALAPDRALLRADGEDVSVITVRINDGKGRGVPLAGNEVTFSLEGPGRILGTGNGDPASHEPDRFIEEVKQATIDGMKAGFAPSGTETSRVGEEFDDSGWPSALDEQGKYAVRPGDSLTAMVLRGSFSLPVLPENAEIRLFPKSLGEVQSVYVNGRRIAEGIRRDDPAGFYRLDRQILHGGKNVYAVTGKPLVPRFLYDDLNTDPGIVQVTLPPAAWKRRAFNGLAQVIVQTMVQPGEIRLTAESAGLKKGVLVLKAQACEPKPAVP